MWSYHVVGRTSWKLSSQGFTNAASPDPPLAFAKDVLLAPDIVKAWQHSFIHQLAPILIESSLWFSIWNLWVSLVPFAVSLLPNRKFLKLSPFSLASTTISYGGGGRGKNRAKGHIWHMEYKHTAVRAIQFHSQTRWPSPRFFSHGLVVMPAFLWHGIKSLLHHTSTWNFFRKKIHIFSYLVKKIIYRKIRISGP